MSIHSQVWRILGRYTQIVSMQILLYEETGNAVESHFLRNLYQTRCEEIRRLERQDFLVELFQISEHFTTAVCQEGNT